MSCKHWKKLDHVTFLIAFFLVGINIFLNSIEITIIAFIFLLAAFIYDVFFE